MNRGVGLIYKAGEHPLFIFISGLASIVALFDVQNYLERNNYTPTLVMIAAVSVFTAYLISLRNENTSLKEIAEDFYQINQIYNKYLTESFLRRVSLKSQEELLKNEQAALNSVCYRISKIFSRTIGKECTATVKLLMQDADGSHWVYTYARSEPDSKRDKGEIRKFSIYKGQNTAFEQCFNRSGDGLPSHFFSANLKKYEGYLNERQDYLKHYRSTIVVPLHGQNENAVATNNREDLIGYLCVDTKSVNRLNNRHHLYMISALSNQMYDFISLMRGRYELTANEVSNEKK